ncbi:MAG TPA: hypothetical protein VFM46_08875, partial [Pseudomonadales bacterium]|nr:hypothetical protein [Pseudomonadales bacterium]
GADSFRVEVNDTEEVNELTLQGRINSSAIQQLKEKCQRLSLANKNVKVNLSNCVHLNNQALAVLLLLAKHKFRQQCIFEMTGACGELVNTLRFHRIPLSMQALGFKSPL